ncbi:cysteine-rich receptor-like protein kinase, partial [Trifolium medium]|nr:cysteine-rich receptor-like protein kinase [Trifolium medium]
TWEKMVIKGKKAFVLKEKLKRLKESLKVWNRDIFGLRDLNIDKTVKELNELEDMVANGIDDPANHNSKDLVKKFWEHFSEEWNNRPFLQGIDFSMLSAEDNASLLVPFEEEEVRDVIWSCDGNKSPGPDGFNLNFFKACWSIVKNDVMAYLHEFHANAILPKAVTASFLSLVPKMDHPQNLFDYRPICLIGSLYKILSKILANRLKRVLGKLISSCQSAFLPQRQILDGVVVLNEIIDLAKRRKDDYLLFKVDFERAYDTVNWGFLEKMIFPKAG